MRIAVVGAGAIGGMLAARLALRGEEVSVVARGAQLTAIRARGLTLREAGGEAATVRVQASDDPSALGAQELVFLTVKAHQLGALAPALAPLLGPGASAVTMQNGIPWWYFHRHGGALEGRRLESVDPGGAVAAHLDPSRVLGTAVYVAAELVEPGVVRHVEGERITIGELDGGQTERVRALSALLRDAGFKAPVTSDLRAELWLKLWGNCALNPLSALTGATLGELCSFPPTRALCALLMGEAQAVAERLGVRFPISLERRLDGAEAVGAHRTSMLQDLEAGRPLELGALVEAVLELGRLVGVATPHLEAAHACVALLARTRGRVR